MIQDHPAPETAPSARNDQWNSKHSGLTGLLMSLAFLLTVLGVTASNAFSTTQIILALLIIATASLPFLLAPLDPDRGRYRLFPLSCLFYGVCFGLPVFLAPIIWPPGVPVTFYTLRFSSYAAIAPVEVLGLILAGLILYILAFLHSRIFCHTRLVPIALAGLSTW